MVSLEARELTKLPDHSPDGMRPLFNWLNRDDVRKQNAADLTARGFSPCQYRIAPLLRLDPGRLQDRQRPQLLAVAEGLDLGRRRRPGRCAEIAVALSTRDRRAP